MEAVMLDFTGTIVLLAALILSINVLTGTMPITAPQRLVLSLGAGLWTVLAAALAGANLCLGTHPVGPPVIGSVIAAPLVVAGFVAARFPAVRATLLAM